MLVVLMLVDQDLEMHYVTSLKRRALQLLASDCRLYDCSRLTGGEKVVAEEKVGVVPAWQLQGLNCK